jgi:flavin-dependent dehydrogenase
MRGGVLQMHRWGLLDRIRSAGTPKIRTTTFYYGSESIEVAIKPRDGVDALYAPRRTLLDETLVEAAEEAGADVLHGVSLEDLMRDRQGRVRGAVVASRDRMTRRVAADRVIGADGRHSRVARLAGAEVSHLAPHSSANVFGYWPDLGLDGYHWHYHPGFGTGAIPTNAGDTCVFAGFSQERFSAERGRGLEWLYHHALASASPELAERVRATGATVKLRAFAGAPGVLRRPSGPGWALVGDAGYFRDPITAHGITDALRDAELLARAAHEGTREAFADYEAIRDCLSLGMLEVTDRLASFEWSLEEAKELHLRLSREMSHEAEYLGTLKLEAGSGS